MENEELKHIAPKLAELKSENTGFKAPEGYFDMLQDKLEVQLIGNDSIPEGYFDTLEDKVFEKLNTSTKVIPLKSSIRKKVAVFSIAASILALVTFQLLNQKTTDPFANLEASEIETWIDDGHLEFNSFEIAASYSNEAIDNLELYDYSDSDLIDYLNDYDVESLLINN